MSKFKKISLLFAIIIVFVSLFFIASCSKSYTPQYQLVNCNVEFNEINNADNTIVYDRKFTENGIEIYFDSELEDVETIDNWIEKVLGFSSRATDCEIYSFPTIYFSDNLIANYTVSDNQSCVTLPTDLLEEEAFAWVLQASSSCDLPYGIFAGIAVHLLNKDDYTGFIVSSVENDTCLTDLQYPLYQQGNLSQGEQQYAWSFSYHVVKELLGAGKTFTDIFNLTKQDLNVFLQEKYKLVLPDYTFYPYSTQFEFKINHGCLTYYINKEFNDFVLPKEVFNTSYSSITAWLKDNMRVVELTDSAFGVTEMGNIDVIVEDGLKSNGIVGEAYADYIKIYSVGAFSHEYTHHALFNTDKDGLVSETLCDIHANTSKFAQSMWYCILTCQSETFPYAQSINEKQHYMSALELYESRSGQQVSSENFNYWLFADCLSALSTEPNQPFLFRFQAHSFYYYIARVYGGESVLEINDYKNTVDGKTIEELLDEWLDYLQQIK